MPRLMPYPRGFVLSEQPLNTSRLPSHYRVLPVVGAWHLAFDPVRRPVVSVDEQTGRFVLVHGTCFVVGEEAVDDVSAWLLGKALRDHEEFLDALDVLAGRHVVVLGDAAAAAVHQDAVGARSVYYSRTAGLVSSHAHLIHDLVPHPPTPRELLGTTPTATWDLSPWEGIRALVPNHRLTVGSWEVERFFPRRPNRFADWSPQRRLEALESMWERQMETTVGAHRDVVVSVTGGADSRVVLAMARRHLPRTKGFTYTSGGNRRAQWGRALSLDERIAGQLREVLPMSHEFFARNDRSAPLTPQLEALLSRNSVSEHGRWLIPHYNRLLSGDDVVHLRGNALEIGRAYYGPTPENDTVDAVRARYARKAAVPDPVTGRTVLNTVQQQYFDDMSAELGYEDQLWGFHRLDLFYWEHRCGRWLTEVLNETDLSFDTLMPVNVRAVLEILLAFDLDDRADAFAYDELIDRNFPVLNFFGKNDDRNLYQQARDERRTPRDEPSEAVRLEECMRVLGADGAVLAEARRPERADLQLPLEHFRAGRRAVRKIVREPVAGSLGFTFHSPYTSARGRGKFAYRLVVSGAVLADVDGAAWGEASRVTVHDLSAEDLVEVQVVALTTMDRPSWSTASRARITDLRHVPGVPDGPPFVATSNPYTVRPG